MGEILIEGSGTLSNVFGRLGNETGGSGTIMVDGGGSQWTNSGSVLIGDQVAGTLTIQNGGTVTNGLTSGYYTGAALGHGANATGTVI